MKTTIIGHRGAAAHALENTIASFKKAKALGVDAIELDVRKTADDVLVVCHDRDMQRIAGTDVDVEQSTWDEIKHIPLVDEVSTIPTLADALAVIGTTPVLIELKSNDCTEPLLATMKQFPKARISVISFKLDELIALRTAAPKLRIYLNDHTNALDTIHEAKFEQFNGVGLNFWLLNPLAYMLARRAGLFLFVYTVNSRILGRLIHMLYPKVGICTDHPEYFITRKKKRGLPHARHV